MRKETLSRIQALRENKSNWPVAWHLGSTFLFIGLAFFAMAQSPYWWTDLLAFITIGFMQYRLVMAIHEATHKNLFQPVAANEALGKLLCASIGMNLALYRKSHLQHHKAPQTIGEDVDARIYQPPLEAKPGMHRLWVLLTGVLRDTADKFVRKFTSKPQFKHVTIETKPDYLQLGLTAVAQIGLIAFFTFYLNWWNYFTHWLVPLVLLAQLLDRIRTFVEHGYGFFQFTPDATIETLPQTTIDIHTNALERYLFAPFGFDLHLAHHAQLTVPFYRLRQLSALLQDEPGYTKPVRASYLELLWKMIFAQRQLVHRPASVPPEQTSATAANPI